MKVPAAKCTSRPDCPCEFCVETRKELSGGRSGRDTQDPSAREFIDTYLRESIHLRRDRETESPEAHIVCPQFGVIVRGLPK
jgi:hypothetical protein